MKNFENLTISDYIDIARRRIWYVVTTTTLVAAGTVLFALRLPAIYKSETTIAISSRFLPENYMPTIDRQTITDRMDFARQQLQSRTFLEGIVEEFHLAGPDGVEKAAEVIRNKIEITVLTANTFKLGFPAADPFSAQAVTKRLTERIIQLNDSFRKEKVQVADQFLEEQLEQAGNELSEAERKLLQLRNGAFPGVTTDVVTPDVVRDLQAQLAKLDAQVESANDQRKVLQRRLEEHRQLKIALNASSPPPPPAAHTESTTAAAIETPPPSPLETELANRQAQLAAASVRYTPRHPEVVRLTQEVRELEGLVRQFKAAAEAAKAAAAATATAEAAKAASIQVQAAKEPKPEEKPRPFLSEFNLSLDTVPAEVQLQIDQLDRDVSKLKQGREPLQARIAAYQNRLNPPAPVAEELARLTRNYDEARQHYNVLAEKRSNSKMAATADSSDNNEMFKVIDAAFLPRQAIGPNRRLIAALGGAAGLVLGFGIAFLREFTDSSLHTEDELAAAIKLPILASIPTVDEKRTRKRKSASVLRLQEHKGGSGHSPLRHVDNKITDAILNPSCSAREHYRFLHSQLLAMQRKKHLKTILISSSGAGEGKTFSACCIAGMLAQEPGKQVLLIDADLRRSTATTVLGTPSREGKNLGAILRGRSKVEESLERCEDLNLYFLSSGPMSSNPGELLSSAHIELVLRECAESFDWVIVDTPPILGAADVNLMAPFCDAILLVVQSGKTPLKVIKDSIKRVGREQICGVILNRVKVARYGSYYDAYYRQPLNESSQRNSNLQLREGI
ncbi:MAG: hypothetical protein DMG15_02240 [Acidobacteria bacterium]|nr:MAG: hypothetical protein DMG15_02240 [Acidobacteriota bacterium]